MIHWIRRWLSPKTETNTIDQRPNSRLALETLEDRAPAATLYSIVDGMNQLLKFSSNSPGTIQQSVQVGGVPAGFTLTGIDYRPRTGQLFGLAINAAGTTAGLGIITLTTGSNPGIASFLPIGVTFAVGASTNTGFDFNPTSDQIRVVRGDAETNLRLTTAGTVITDLPDFPLTPTGRRLGEIAYDRNYDSRLGPNGSTVFGINTVDQTMMTIGGLNGVPSPRTGFLFPVGPLGTPIDTIDPNNSDTTVSVTGFDIHTTPTGANEGFAVFDGDQTTGLNVQLYNVNTGIGTATPIGQVDVGLRSMRGLAIVPESSMVVAINGEGAADSILSFYDGLTNQLRFSLIPFAGYRGALITGSGDVNNDGVPDAVVAAHRSAGHVKAFDGRNGNELQSNIAFEGFTGTVNAACGDVDGDGYHDLIVSANNANGHVKAFSGQFNGFVLTSFLAFQFYAGPASVASADLNNDGRDEIFVGSGGRGTNTRVAVFNGDGTARPDSGGFAAFPGYTGELLLSAGDFNGDGFADIITGALTSSNGHIKAFSGADTNADGLADFTLLSSFFTATGNPSGFLDPLAFETGFSGPSFGGVGVADFNADGRYEIRVARYDNIASTNLISAYDFNNGLVNSFNIAGLPRAGAVSGARY